MFCLDGGLLNLTFSLMHWKKRLTLSQTMAYSHETIGIHIKMITQAPETVLWQVNGNSQEPDPHNGWLIWLSSLQHLLFKRKKGLHDFILCACRWNQRLLLGSCGNPWWDLYSTPCPLVKLISSGLWLCSNTCTSISSHPSLPWTLPWSFSIHPLSWISFYLKVHPWKAV